MTFYLNYLNELTKRVFGLNDSIQQKDVESLASASSFQQSSCLYQSTWRSIGQGWEEHNNLPMRICAL